MSDLLIKIIGLKSFLLYGDRAADDRLRWFGPLVPVRTWLMRRGGQQAGDLGLRGWALEVYAHAQ